MKFSELYGIATLLLAAVVSLPAAAQQNPARNRPNPTSALPGTVNYVEGHAFAADQPLDKDSVGHTTLAAGQLLNTDAGKVELLLTPGVFLRVGDNSTIKITALSLEDTELQVVRGHAIVEVDQIYPQNNLRVQEGDSTARLLKPGLYDFDLQQNQMRVFDGEAEVQDGDHQIKLKGGHDLAVSQGAGYKPAKFDKKADEKGDDLYRWSSLRSDYEAEANVDAARIVYAGGWGGGYGPWGAGFYGAGWGGYGGWYWDPWFSAFTFMPLDGIFYSPFGWGFYSPAFVYRAPFYGGHFYHTFNAASVRAWGAGPHYATSRGYAHGVYNGAGAARGAFHSGPVSTAHSGFGGGGFHGGGASGGGFHGAGGDRAGGR